MPTPADTEIVRVTDDGERLVLAVAGRLQVYERKGDRGELITEYSVFPGGQFLGQHRSVVSASPRAFEWSAFVENGNVVEMG